MGAYLNSKKSAIFLRRLGASIGSLGVAVFIISVWTMADNWRAGAPKADKTELVSAG